MTKPLLSLIAFLCVVIPTTVRADISEDVELQVHTQADQTTFHIGELITLQLSYSLRSTASDSYTITNANYDRSGRLGIEKYEVEPNSEWDDPLKLYFHSYGGFTGGGLSGQGKLSTKATVIFRPLNEWVRFNQPGVYRLLVASSRVSRTGAGFQSPASVLRSNVIRLTIVPATPAWRRDTLAQAVAVLARDSGRDAFFNTDDSVKRAAATLRYLGTPEAAREMASRIDDKRVGFEFRLGLASTPAREAALDKLQALFSDPDFPVSPDFLDVMSLVTLPAEESAQRSQERAQVEDRLRLKLTAELDKKRGKALTVSAFSIVEEAGMYSRIIPPEEKRLLSAKLASGFDTLPVESQLALLQYRWQALDAEAMRPLLPVLAQRYRDFPELRTMDAYQINQVSSSALAHWWEIDPEAARPAVIQEIIRPRPRFGANVLGMLPDKELPEVEGPLVNHLSKEEDNQEQIASLISRYATKSVEPQVSDFLNGRIGKLACAVQSPLLAYFLRVDSHAALAQIETAMAARGRGFTACNHTLLMDVADLQHESSLQEIALASLGDDDPQIVGNAATYLSNYGTAAAEEALWARLRDWSRRWRGRDSELRYVPGESLDGEYERGAGSNLIDALARGQAWLTDDVKMNELVDLSVESNQRRQTEQFREAWLARPRRIQFNPYGGGQFEIAQYHASSSKIAIEKLGQFPPGATFEWMSNPKSDIEQKAFEEISKAAAQRGIVITRK